MTIQPPTQTELSAEFYSHTHILLCLAYRQETRRLTRMFRGWRDGHVDGRLVTLQSLLVKQLWREAFGR